MPYEGNLSWLYCLFPIYKKAKPGMAPIPCSMTLVLFFELFLLGIMKIVSLILFLLYAGAICII